MRVHLNAVRRIELAGAGTFGAELLDEPAVLVIFHDARVRVAVGDKDVAGTPWEICITSGPHQYLYSSDSNTGDFDPATIYKMELDGTVLGKFGAGGKQLKEFGTIHQMDCRKDNELYVAEILNWRVQKLNLHPDKVETSRSSAAR